MRYIVKAVNVDKMSSCDAFCFMKCDRVGKCVSKQR